MRAVLGACAVACALGAVLSALDGNWGHAAAWAFGFWMACGWYIAVSVSMAAKAGDEGFQRGEEHEER
jgi:hypothetical protein